MEENIKQIKEKLRSYKREDIKFHPDFEKGMRLAVCLNCGYPYLFMGSSEMLNDCCKKPKVKIYELKKLEDFILKLQEIHYKNTTKHL